MALFRILPCDVVLGVFFFVLLSSLFQIQFYKLWVLVGKLNQFTFSVSLVGYICITLFLVWDNHAFSFLLLFFLCLLLVWWNVVFSLFYLLCNKLFCWSVCFGFTVASPGPLGSESVMLGTGQIRAQRSGPVATAPEHADVSVSPPFLGSSLLATLSPRRGWQKNYTSLS